MEQNALIVHYLDEHKIAYKKYIDNDQNTIIESTIDNIDLVFCSFQDSHEIKTTYKIYKANNIKKFDIATLYAQINLFKLGEYFDYNLYYYQDKSTIDINHRFSTYYSNVLLSQCIEKIVQLVSLVDNEYKIIEQPD